MRIIKTLKSRRYAVTFIILIIISLVLATAIPQRSRMGEAEWFRLRFNHPQLVKVIKVTGLDHLYTTWWFLAIVGLFSLNLGLNLSERVTITYRQFKDRRFLSFPQIVSLPLSETLSVSGNDPEVIERIENLLKGFRYRVAHKEDSLMAEKGRVAYWWVPMFHGSILLVLLGVLISGLFRFSGTIELSESQAFHGKEDEFINRWYGLSGYRPDMDFLIRLKGFKAEYWDSGHPKLYQSLLEVKTVDDDTYTRAVEMNSPLRQAGYRFYQTKYWGYSALFGLTRKGKGIESTGYVNLPYEADYRDKSLKQDFNIPGTGLRAYLEYKPPGEGINVEIREGSKVIYHGTLENGQGVELNDYILRFHGTVKWTGFYISYDPGVGVVYSGFAILVLSSLGMVFIYPRRLWVAMNEGIIAVGADAGRRREEFRGEFEEIVERMREVIT